MTTPPPDSQAQSETLREVAERIVRETILVVPGKIADRYIDAIEAALRNERERCAKIAENFKGGYTIDPVTGVLIEDEDGPWSLPINVARAIREGR